MKKPLSGMLPDDIFSIPVLDRKFRAQQIFRSIHKNLNTVNEITTLPLDLRGYISENYTVFTSECDEILEDDDGSIKLRLTLEDNNKIECVVLPDKSGRKTACLSTQAGCAMGCSFCKTGESGFFRNLEAHEIAEQMLYINKHSGKISNIVFMGMGEPLENLENLFKAAEIFHHTEGQGISFRKMTVSTCGLADKIMFMAQNGPDFRLAVSLNSADQKKREIIMPAARAFRLDKLKDSLLFYQSKRDKRITLEYVLMENFNTGEEDAKNLKKFIAGLSAIVNVIPLNPVPGLPWKTPSRKEIDSFCAFLEKYNINYSIRRKKGSSINGACGQLAAGPHRPLSDI